MNPEKENTMTPRDLSEPVDLEATIIDETDRERPIAGANSAELSAAEDDGRDSQEDETVKQAELQFNDMLAHIAPEEESRHDLI